MGHRGNEQSGKQHPRTYQPRHYRKRFRDDRFHFFTSVCKESDLMIGVARDGFDALMPERVRALQEALYGLLQAHEKAHPGFLHSLEPLDMPRPMEAVGDWERACLNSLYACGQASGTGPMAAVAGLFAREAGQLLLRDFGLDEVMVENGGDLFLARQEALVLGIHAGSSPLSDQVALEVPPGQWGICTSSGTLGHSFSRGRADALCVACRDAPLADAWATALANQVQGEAHIETVLEQSARIPEIEACLLVVGERMGVRGNFELKNLT